MARPTTLRDGLPRFRRICRHLWPRVRQHRLLLWGSLVSLCVGIVLRLLEPWPLKFVLDRVIGVNRPEGRADPLRSQELEPMTLLAVCAVAVVLISGSRALAEYYRTVGFALMGNRVLTQLRGDVYRHLQCLSLSFHNKARNGDLIVRVTGDINMLKDVAVSAVLPLLASTFMLVGMLAVMFWLHWRLTLLALSVVPLFWLTTIHLSRRIHDAARQQRRREGDMAATAAESIAAVKVVQALSLEDVFDKGFSSHNKKSEKQGVRTSRLSASLERTVEVLISIATALVLWYGARLVMRTEMSPGSLIVFLTYLKRAFRPLQDFAKYTGRLAKATAAGERVVELLDRTPELRDLPGAVQAPPLAGSVRFEGVGFAYDQTPAVFNGIHLSAAAGQRVALVGPSGVGKSTLISLLLRLYDPTRGRVMIDGRDIREFTLSSLRSQISVVLQDNFLFAASVWDNIAYGAPGATLDSIRAAAALAKAHEFIEALPEGYDTILGERGVTLSHGQRQRIAIARAAVRKSPILLLDEPTTGLDEENEQAVVDALEVLSRGVTTLIVTHNLRWAARAATIVYLEEGRICEQGTHHALMRLNGRYARLYHLQTRDQTSDVQKGAVHAGVR